MSSCVSAPAEPVSMLTRSAHVTFLSDPEGAYVTVNGRPLAGTTPIHHVAVDPGFAVVRFGLSRHFDREVQRTFEPGEAVRIDVHLVGWPTPTPSPTRTPTPTRPPITHGRPLLNIYSDPPGASVLLDGVLLPSTTPIESLEVAAGAHTIEIRSDRFEPVRVHRRLAMGALDTVDVQLLIAPARVTFTSEPPGAKVYVNGVTLEGTTPIKNAQLPAERSEIVFELEGFKKQGARRSWQPNMVDYVDVDLEPLPAKVTFVSEPPGASITVNGRELGRARIEEAELAPGPARITFSLEDFDTVTVERTWEPGQVDSVEVVLFPVVGRATFTSEAPWVRLEVDGEPTVAAPGTPIELLEGFHIVRAYRGNQVAVAEFKVIAGDDVTVPLDWQRWRPDIKQYALIPAGKVAIGDDKYGDHNPERQVDAPSFWLGRTEVTVSQYRLCMEEGACPQPALAPHCNWSKEDTDNHPVNCVRASDAEAYARWLSQRANIDHRLPTCTEWEVAARKEGRYPWGDEEPGGRCNSCDMRCPYPHFRNERIDDGWRETAPTGHLNRCRNKSGVFDLIGNVAEWCTRPPGDKETPYEVRGGSWGQTSAFLDPAFASRKKGDQHDPTVGFRLVVPHDRMPAREENRPAETP